MELFPLLSIFLPSEKGQLHEGAEGRALSPVPHQPQDRQLCVACGILELLALSYLAELNAAKT